MYKTIFFNQDLIQIFMFQLNLLRLTFLSLVNFLLRFVLLFGDDLYQPLNADINIVVVSLLA